MDRLKHKVYMIRFWICATLLLPASTTFANGGGTWINSPVFSVGNPVFRDISEVNILSERLYIKLGHSHTDIRVKYILWNHSDKDLKDVDYAFPVDFVNGDYEQYDRSMTWWQTPINYVEFVVDGKKLTHTSGPEILLNKRTEENNDEYLEAGWSFAGSSVYRKWFYTRFSIPKHSFLTLEVNYSVDSPYYGDGDAPYEYDRGVFNILNYDFSPASHWGDGIIRDFYVQMDASELMLGGRVTAIKTISPDFEYSIWGRDSGNDSDKDTIWVSGLQFHGDGPFYTCHMQNYDLKKSQPLRIHYYHPSSFYSLLDCYVPHNEYRMKVSSEQKDYPAGNLTDMNLTTAWVPANKGGIGDWIEFDFKEEDSLGRVTSLFLVNGYHKNQTSYEQNNRIKRVKVTLTSFSHDEDENETGIVDTFYYSFPDAPYQSINLTMLANQSTYVENERYNTTIYETPTPVFDLFLTDDLSVKSIRITITDVYKGTKYDDTCISEILLYRFGTYDRYLPAFYDRYRKK